MPGLILVGSALPIAARPGPEEDRETRLLATLRQGASWILLTPLTPTPQMQAGLAAFKAALEASTPPRQVADQVFDAIKKEQFYILSDPEWTEVIRLRTDSLLRMENPQSPVATIVKLMNSGRVKDEVS